MSEILLVDFGASRIKAVLFDVVNSNVIDAEECISPSTKSSSSLDDRFEIPIEAYWNGLLDTVGKIILRNKKKKISKLWMCAEMHGFVMTHPDGSAITPYISWKDQRANFDFSFGSSSTYEKLIIEFNNFRTITGMNLKPGLPIVTYASGVREGSIPELKTSNKDAPVRILSLVDWLLFRGGERFPRSNITLALGLGIYDLDSKILSNEVLRDINLHSIKICGMDLQSDSSIPLGRIKINDSVISVFGGLGDFQAALYGAGFFKDYDAILNLGTGSQVGVKKSKDMLLSSQEVRVTADNELINVVTHIPCGRALNVYASFLDNFSIAAGGKEKFWQLWSEISADDVIKSKLCSNLSLFESAWGRGNSNFKNGTIGLDEGRSSVPCVMAGIAKSWVLQYYEVLNILDPLAEAKKVVICGGLAHKSKFLISVLEALMPKRVFEISTTITGEETLDGLLRLAITNNQEQYKFQGKI